MYKFENKKRDSVFNTETGERGIRPGVWQWKVYEKWLKMGNKTAEPDDTTPQERAAMLQKIVDEAEKRHYGGLKVDGIWYNTDIKSRTLINTMSAYSLSSKKNSMFSLLCCDGSNVGVDSAGLNVIIEKLFERDQLILSVMTNHIALLATVEDPSSYDFSTGWPEVYEKGR